MKDKLRDAIVEALVAYRESNVFAIVDKVHLPSRIESAMKELEKAFTDEMKGGKHGR